MNLYPEAVMFEAVFNPIEVYLLICLAAAAGFIAGMDSLDDPYDAMLDELAGAEPEGESTEPPPC